MTNKVARELGPVQNVFQAKNRGIERAEIQKMARNGEIDCDECNNRQVQEKSGSSIPAPAAPKASSAVQKSGEQQPAQHQASGGGHSRAQSATCPDCGRVYVSGGEGEEAATTQIKYNEENPYAQGFKIADSAVVAGQNMDMEI